MANFKMKPGAKIVLVGLIIAAVFVCVWHFKKPDSQNNAVNNNVDTVKSVVLNPTNNVVTNTISVIPEITVAITPSISTTTKVENTVVKEKRKPTNTSSAKPKEKKKDKERENLNVTY